MLPDTLEKLSVTRETQICQRNLVQQETLDKPTCTRECKDGFDDLVQIAQIS